MSKIMQKIVLFIEPNDDAFFTSLKIGNLFMNRFAVEEDANSEVLKIFELEKSCYEISNPSNKEFSAEKKQKGKDLKLTAGVMYYK